MVAITDSELSPLADSAFGYYFRSYLPVLVAAAIASTPLGAALWRKLPQRAARVLGTLAILAGLTLCTATCKPTHVVTPILEEQGLSSYFSFVGGASMDESRDNKTDVIRHVLDQPVMQGKRVLMVGDRCDDMQGARNCGLDAAAVLYGYGSREEVTPFAPVFMAADCKELTEWILRPVDELSHS